MNHKFMRFQPPEGDPNEALRWTTNSRLYEPGEADTLAASSRVQ